VFVARVVSRPGIWLWWILANAVGYAVGVALWQAAYAEMRLTLRLPIGGIALLAGFGATVGLSAGLAQSVALRYGAVRAGAWVVAMAAGCAAGFIVAAAIGGALSEALEPRLGIPLTDAIVVLLFGAIVGAGIGGARWLLLRAYGVAASRWALASVLGLMIAYPLGIGVLELLPELDQPVVGLAFGFCAGATTALIEWLIASRQISLELGEAEAR
jgi:hypothetical protein